MIYSDTQILRAVALCFDQLRRENCVKVSANPFSEINPFISEVIYSLEWGESSNAISLTSTLPDRILPQVGIIQISLDDHFDEGSEQPIIIISKWTQRGSKIIMQNSCNYENERTEEFSTPDMYIKAASMLKKLVRESVAYMAGKKLVHGR